MQVDKIYIGGTYQHFKGALCVVCSISLHTETQEDLVIYRRLGDSKMYARPIHMFLSDVDKKKYPKCTQAKRFKYLGGGREYEAR